MTYISCKSTLDSTKTQRSPFFFSQTVYPVRLLTPSYVVELDYSYKINVHIFAGLMIKKYKIVMEKACTFAT